MVVRRGSPPISPRLLSLCIPVLIQVTHFFLPSTSPHSPDFFFPSRFLCCCYTSKYEEQNEALECRVVGRRRMENGNLKLWNTALPTQETLGSISSPKRLRPMESRWGWGCLGAFRTSRIRLLGHRPSRCMPLRSKLTSCLTISSLFPQ